MERRRADGTADPYHFSSPTGKKRVAWPPARAYMTRVDDVLSDPARGRLFRALAELRRPAATQELAELVSRHPNSVRVQLQRLERAGLIERRSVHQARGRPRHSWAIRPEAPPASVAPDAHSDLSRWLARATLGAHALVDVGAAGREIGRGLAPEAGAADARAVMHDALSALGFAPRDESPGLHRFRYVLTNCPYRDAVAENAAVVCTLHRGITQGLLDRVDPGSRVTAFVARDPVTAGCVIEAGAG